MSPVVQRFSAQRPTRDLVSVKALCHVPAVDPLRRLAQGYPDFWWLGADPASGTFRRVDDVLASDVNRLGSIDPLR